MGANWEDVGLRTDTRRAKSVSNEISDVITQLIVADDDVTAGFTGGGVGCTEAGAAPIAVGWEIRGVGAIAEWRRSRNSSAERSVWAEVIGMMVRKRPFLHALR